LNSKFMEQFHYKHAEPLDENDWQGDLHL